MTRSTLAELLDLETSWAQTKDELRYAAVRAPFELELIEVDEESWLSQVVQEIESGTYAPSPMELTELPKASGIVRPIAHLVPKDRLVYRALVHACVPSIQPSLAWSQRNIDFAYVIRKDAADGVWFRSPFRGWKQFRAASLREIEAGASYVAFTDIAAYYEQIDLGILASTMREVGCPTACVEMLGRCLNRWAVVPGRGLPQGPDASNLLAKLYLNVVDQTLVDEGIKHVRYSDDIRVFCHTRSEAERKMAFLARSLRPLGLTLQTAKSRILRAREAREETEGVVPVLRQILIRWADEISDLVDWDEEPYPQVFQIDAALDDNLDDVPIEAIREAFNTYFIDDPAARFDRTLFHFLLGRLGKAKDDLAVPHVPRYLRNHPEETSQIIDYLYRLDAYPRVSEQLRDFLGSAQATVYPHQAYQLMRWVARQRKVEPHTVGIARKWAFDSGTPRHLRAICRQIVGQHGTVADRQRLIRGYDLTPDPLERAQIICCLGKLEKGRRNAFLGRARTDHDLSRRASEYVKARLAS